MTGVQTCALPIYLYWIVGVALLVLFEKTVPAGHRLGYATGVALLVCGAGMLAVAF